MRPGSEVARHRHVCGPVLGSCLEGSWRYRERSWEGRPGTLVSRHGLEPLDLAF